MRNTHWFISAILREVAKGGHVLVYSPTEKRQQEIIHVLMQNTLAALIEGVLHFSGGGKVSFSLPLEPKVYPIIDPDYIDEASEFSEETYNALLKRLKFRK